MIAPVSGQNVVVVKKQPPCSNDLRTLAATHFFQIVAATSAGIFLNHCVCEKERQRCIGCRRTRKVRSYATCRAVAPLARSRWEGRMKIAQYVPLLRSGKLNQNLVLMTEERFDPPSYFKRQLRTQKK